jgi:hypothetical protein
MAIKDAWAREGMLEALLKPRPDVDRLRRGDVIRLAGGESATLDELPWLDGDGLRRARVKLADGSLAEAVWPSRFAEPIVVPRPS